MGEDSPRVVLARADEPGLFYVGGLMFPDAEDPYHWIKLDCLELDAARRLGVDDVDLRA
jgi:hypothetical protein